MKQEPLKDKQCQVRMPQSLYDEAEKVATSYGTTVSTLARFLIERFVDATKEHGSKVKFPPEFDYTEADSIVESKKKRDAYDKAG